MFPDFQYTFLSVTRQLQVLPLYLLGAVLALFFTKLIIQAFLSLLGLRYFAGAAADMILIATLLALATSALSGQGPLAQAINGWVYQVTAPIVEIAHVLENSLPY